MNVSISEKKIVYRFQKKYGDSILYKCKSYDLFRMTFLHLLVIILQHLQEFVTYVIHLITK